MKRYTAQQTVGEGIYFSPRHLAFRSMQEPGPLPGREGDTYLRVPALALLLVGLPLSVAYVIFLPVIGFVMLFGALHDKVRHHGERVAQTAETEVPTRNADESFGARVEPVPEAVGLRPSQRAA